MTTAAVSRLTKDRDRTLRNRATLEKNVNLLFWYERLYRHQFKHLPNFDLKQVLEVGSGTSPLKRIHPNVLTSDVLDLEHLDYVFDCHEIHRFDKISDESLDVITLTNVLHHLHDPVAFLENAGSKLKKGGCVIATEPYVSVVSKVVYDLFHQEPLDFSIDKPTLEGIEGPLSSANIALPYMIFHQPYGWSDRLLTRYRLKRLQPYTGLSYMLSGGISRRLPIPSLLYKILFACDEVLATAAPQVVASFFTIELLRL